MLAQTTDDFSDEKTETEIAEEEAIEADTDGSLDDATNSIDVRRVLHGIGLTADVRVGYSRSEIDARDNTNQTEDIVRARWRFRTEVEMFSSVRTVGRIAGL